MPDEVEALRAEIADLRTQIEALRAELAELRAYIGEVPSMECGITSFEEWQEDQGSAG